jgi:hypothetical protein
MALKRELLIIFSPAAIAINAAYSTTTQNYD